MIKLELLGVGGVRVLGYKYIHTARVCRLCRSSVVVQAFGSRPGCLTQKQVQYEGVKGGRCDGDGDAHQPRAVTARRGLCVGVTQLECHCCLRRERPASLVLHFSVCVQSRSLPSCNPVGGHVATSSRLIWSSAYPRHGKAGDTAGCHCDDDDKDCLRYEVRTGCKRESARPLEFSLDGEALCIGRLIRHLPATYNLY